LTRLAAAVQSLQNQHPCQVEVLVVDNRSTDRTPMIAQDFGATVVQEPIRNIARARNTGARKATGEVLFFLDADTLVPPTVLTCISKVMGERQCVGGAVDMQHNPSRILVRLYLRFWRILGRLCGMAQGSGQFWRREEFFQAAGYDETIYMGEDVEFYWRMTRAARRTGRKLSYVSEVQVVPSPRRFDRWPLWKTTLWTNPLLIALLCRKQRPWHGWYEDVPR
jgi:glycosyltransferase involved in cell wall biosynthesis